MPLEDPDVRDRLIHLIHLDIDAVAVYEDVLGHVRDDDVRKNFKMFMADHTHHIDKLSTYIRDLGGEVPERKPDMSGKLAEWASGFRARLSEEGPVKAMHSAEEYHVNRYGEAAGWDVAEDISKTLKSFLEDEHRHLAYTEEHIAAASSRR